MNKGVIISGVGHVSAILWLLFGGYFSFPEETPEVAVTSVSLITSDQLAQLQEAANSTPDPAPTPEAAAPEVTPPEPVEPEVTPVEPAVEPPPPIEVVEPPPVEPVVEPTVEPEVIAPEPIAPPAEIEQPIPVPVSTLKPRPRPSVRVADMPVPPPPEDVAVADEVTPAVTDEPAPETQVVEEPVEAAAPEEASPTIVTETTEPVVEDAPTLAPTSSIRPKKRPAKPEVAETAEAPTEPAVDTAAAEAEAAAAAEAEAAAADAAVQAALADAAGEATADTGTDGGNTGAEGPPMTAGEKDAFRVSVEKNWNVAALSTEALRTTVIVYVAVAQDGTPDATSIRMISFSGGSEAAANQAFQVARRAILRSGAEGFKLPADKYDTWKELELVFDSKGMGL